jgi:queuosine biosynthesis protein QueD
VISIVKQMYTETAHRLLNYNGRCAHIHGHSWLWEVEVAVPSPALLDDRGMVLDFADLKKAMHTVLDPWDHALLLHANDPLLSAIGDNWFNALSGSDGTQARLFTFPFNPTSEQLALLAKTRLEDIFANIQEISILRVSCKETASSQCNIY